MYEFITYIGPYRMRRCAVGRAGRTAQRAAACLLAAGDVSVRGGIGAGLRLCRSHLALDHQQGFWLVRGTLEPDVQEALRRSIEPGAVVFDIGANIAFFTLVSARLAGAHGCVFAFEPVGESCAAIKANTAVNARERERLRGGRRISLGDEIEAGALPVPDVVKI
jgi:hypothetical protein